MEFSGDVISSRYSFDDRDVEHALGGSTRSENVGQGERVASAVAGGILAVAGLSLIARGHPVAGALFGAAGGGLAYRSATGHCAAYERLGVGEEDAGPASAPWTRELEVHESIAVNRSASDLYAFWRNFENLPHVMSYLERVDVLEDGRSHWVAKGIGDHPVTWTARTTLDRPDELIAWSTLEDSDVSSSGSVEFAPLPGDAGTLVRVQMRYQPPGGAVGAVIAKVLGRAPSRTLHKDLRRFRAAMEAGGLPTTEGQPRGNCR